MAMERSSEGRASNVISSAGLLLDRGGAGLGSVVAANDLVGDVKGEVKIHDAGRSQVENDVKALFLCAGL